MFFVLIRQYFQELAVLEAEHKRMEEEEAKNDVTKQNDLSAFYRNILDKRTEVRSVAEKISKESKDLDSVLKGEAPVEIKEEPTEEPKEKKDAEKDMKLEAKKAIANARSYRKKSSEQAAGNKTDSDSGEDENTDDKVKEKLVEGDEDDKDDLDSSEDEKDNKDDKEDNQNKDDKDDSSSEDEKDVKPAMAERPKLLLTVEEEREARLKMVNKIFKNVNINLANTNY